LLKDNTVHWQVSTGKKTESSFRKVLESDKESLPGGHGIAIYFALRCAYFSNNLSNAGINVWAMSERVSLTVCELLIRIHSRKHTKPEREHQLRTGHEKLWRETLEESSGPFILHHVGNNLEASLGIFKVSVKQLVSGGWCKGSGWRVRGVFTCSGHGS
jgi:hypothetical protein